MTLKIIDKTKFADKTKPQILEETNVQLYLRMSASTESDDYDAVHTIDSSNEGEFVMSYNYWRNNTIMRSVNNFDDNYFRIIKYRRDDYLPYIKKSLQNGDLTMLRILERIYPEKCPYIGYISTKLARKKWLRIL